MMKRLLFLLLIPAAAFPQAVKYTSQFRGGQIDTILSQAQYVGSPVWNVANAPFNAAGDSTADDRAEIQQAIDSAEADGKGVVYLPAGVYKLSTYLTGKVFLQLRSNNVAIIGAGMGQTVICVDTSGTVLDIRPSDTTLTYSGIMVRGITFKYTGGLKAHANGFSYGIQLNGVKAKIEDCEFKNFLNQIYLRQPCYDVLCAGNVLTWDHGRASVCYPLKGDVGQSPAEDPYFLHPVVAFRDWGHRDRFIGNFIDGMLDSNFTGISAADSFKIPIDGALHGTHEGVDFSHNTVIHGSYELVYSEAGSDPNAQTIIVGNYLDGRIPAMTEGRQTGIGALPYSMEHNPPQPDTLRYSGWGIKADGYNITITGNDIRNAQMGIHVTQFQSPGAEKLNIGPNLITNYLYGIWLDSVSTGTVHNNFMVALSPSALERVKGYTPRTGIMVYASKKLNISSNTVVTTQNDWYYRTVTLTDTAFVTAKRFYISDTTGIRAGRDWVRYNFIYSSDVGSIASVTAVGANYVDVDTIYTAVDSGATLWIQPRFESGKGITALYSDSCAYQGNTFYSNVEGISGLGTSDIAWPVHLFNTISTQSTDITGSGATLTGDADITGNVQITDATGTQRHFRALNLQGGTYSGISNTGRSFLSQLRTNGDWRRNLIYQDSSDLDPIKLGGNVEVEGNLTITGTPIDFQATDTLTTFAAADVAATTVPIRSYKGSNTQTNKTNWISGVWDAYIRAWNSGFSSQGQQQIGRWQFQSDYDADGRLDNSTFKVRLAANNSGSLSDVFSVNNAGQMTVASWSAIRPLYSCGMVDTMYTSDTVEVGWVYPASTIDTIIYSGGRTISLTAQLELVDSLYQTEGVMLVDTTTCTTMLTKRSAAVGGGTFSLTAGKLLRLVFPALATVPKSFAVTIVGHR